METVKKPATISTYIPTHNGLFFQSTLEHTIRQALLFSDEIIIVNSEQSSDGTQILLDDLKSEYPDKINLYTYKEDDSKKWQTVAEKKTFALQKCTKDYCILQDDDEMIHEKHIDTIHRLPIVFPDTIAFRFDVIHFYRSFTHYQPPHGDWYGKKIYMVKNIKEISHGLVGSDPDNHLISGMPLDSMPDPQVINIPVTVFHYGWCRNDAILLMKKYFMESLFWGADYWKDHEFPFKLEDPAKLPEFTGTHPRYMIPVIESEKRNTRHIKEFSSSNNQPPYIPHISGIDMKKWWDSYLCISRKDVTDGIGNDHMDLEKLQPYIDEFSTHIPAGQYRKVIDIGAGDGGETKLLLEKGYDVTGITFGQDNIRMAKEQYNIELMNTDMHILDYPPESFDAIFLLQTFEHFLSPFIACMEMWRVLRTGGRVYVCVPDPDNDKEWTIWHTNLLYPRQIIKLFDICGFSCIHQDSQKHVENIDKRYPRFVFEKVQYYPPDKWNYMRFIHDARNKDENLVKKGDRNAN